MDIVRIIFEKGLEVGSAPNSVKLPASCNTFASIVGEMQAKYQVRPVLLTQRYPWGVGQPVQLETHLLLSLVGGQYPELTLSELAQAQGLHTNKRLPLFLKTLNLAYLVGGVIYHCKRLALAYSQICNDMLRISSIEGYGDNPFASYGHQPEPYYEFDALVTAARRSYDSTRYILWDIFGPGGASVPSNFLKTLPTCGKLPETLKQRLETSWSRFGERLTDYRDCIQHYVPVNFGMSDASMSKLDGGVWSSLIRIPDNPEVRSKTQFRYSGGLDALTCGWELANEVVTIAAEIMRAVSAATLSDTPAG